MDAKVTNVLCIGGACKYQVHEGSDINSAFILDHVVPGIYTRFPKDVSIILGTALLWLIFSEHADKVPNTIRNRVQLMYNNYRNPVFEETNPVKRLPIIITGNEGQVYMDEIDIGEGSSGDNQSGTTIADRPMREQQLAIYSQLKLMNNTINELCVKIEEGEIMNHRHYQNINKNIQRMTMLSFTRSNARVTQEQSTVTPTRQSASLSNTPRTLYVL